MRDEIIGVFFIILWSFYLSLKSYHGIRAYSCDFGSLFNQLFFIFSVQPKFRDISFSTFSRNSAAIFLRFNALISSNRTNYCFIELYLLINHLIVRTIHKIVILSLTFSINLSSDSSNLLYSSLTVRHHHVLLFLHSISQLILEISIFWKMTNAKTDTSQNPTSPFYIHPS